MLGSEGTCNEQTRPWPAGVCVFPLGGRERERCAPGCDRMQTAIKPVPELAPGLRFSNHPFFALGWSGLNVTVIGTW